MRGPYRLTPHQVNMRVPNRMKGVYCLGKDRDTVEVVGRTDKDLQTAIKDNWRLYELFWYEPALTPSEGFKIHCEVFHKYLASGHLKEDTHPVPPDKSDAKCPVCGK